MYDAIERHLEGVDANFARQYPGDTDSRQPIHTVYVPADRYQAGLALEWGRTALEAFERHCATAPDLARIAGLSEDTGQVHTRVRAKLALEPIEDLRIDFEDGLGAVPDEDAVALAAADSLVADLAAGCAPPFTGIRFKSLEAATRRRGIRTLDVFLGRLRERHGALPSGFVVTLPKVTSVAQTSAMVALAEQLEHAHDLPTGALRFELQIETPQAVLGADGTATVARMIHAADGRCTALHYGTYDYSAAIGIAAGYQSLDHPAADHAKAIMQLAAAGTGVRLSDGSSNMLPVGSPAQREAAWRTHARLVHHSLERGFYQGWDLHPHQLITRYAATYTFFRGSLDQSSTRLRDYLTGSDNGVLDEPATARALAGFLLRGLDCGAVDEGEIRDGAGIGRVELAALGRRD